jgi:hypothetical protein
MMSRPSPLVVTEAPAKPSMPRSLTPESSESDDCAYGVLLFSAAAWRGRCQQCGGGVGRRGRLTFSWMICSSLFPWYSADMVKVAWWWVKA